MSATRRRDARDEALVAAPTAQAWIAARRASNGAPVPSCPCLCGYPASRCPVGDTAADADRDAWMDARRDEAVEHQDAELAAL